MVDLAFYKFNKSESYLTRRDLALMVTNEQKTPFSTQRGKYKQKEASTTPFACQAREDQASSYLSLLKA